LNWYTAKKNHYITQYGDLFQIFIKNKSIFSFNFNCNSIETCVLVEMEINGVPLKVKTKQLQHIKYQEWLNVISTLVFGVLMKKINTRYKLKVEKIINSSLQ
jgi:hypothetical protein